MLYIKYFASSKRVLVCIRASLSLRASQPKSIQAPAALAALALVALELELAAEVSALANVLVLVEAAMIVIVVVVVAMNGAENFIIDGFCRCCITVGL